MGPVVVAMLRSLGSGRLIGRQLLEFLFANGRMGTAHYFLIAHVVDFRFDVEESEDDSTLKYGKNVITTLLISLKLGRS